jgi:hypothetical protein
LIEIFEPGVRARDIIRVSARIAAVFAVDRILEGEAVDKPMLTGHVGLLTETRTELVNLPG